MNKAPTKTEQEKRSKARTEARPKKILEIAGWTISADSRQFITTKGNVYHYFPMLEHALYDIGEDMVKEKLEGATDIENAIKVIRKERIAFLKDVSTAVHALGREQKAIIGKVTL